MTTEREAMTARIIELETRLAFQDDTIEELNGVLVCQQQQLDRLEKDFELIRQRLKQFLAGDDGDHGC